MNRNERLIVRTIIAEAIKAGWQLFSVHDGEEETETSSADTVIELGVNLEEFHLTFVRGEGEARSAGTVSCIFSNGNDGLDVISDYTTNLTFMETGVNEYIDELAIEWNSANDLYRQDAASKARLARVQVRDKLDLAARDLQDALRGAIPFIGYSGSGDEERKAAALVALEKSGLTYGSAHGHPQH